jgi:hypothetical protein
MLPGCACRTLLEFLASELAAAVNQARGAVESQADATQDAERGTLALGQGIGRGATGGQRSNRPRRCEPSAKQALDEPEKEMEAVVSAAQAKSVPGDVPGALVVPPGPRRPRRACTRSVRATSVSTSPDERPKKRAVQARKTAGNRNPRTSLSSGAAPAGGTACIDQDEKAAGEAPRPSSAGTHARVVPPQPRPRRSSRMPARQGAGSSPGSGSGPRDCGLGPITPTGNSDSDGDFVPDDDFWSLADAVLASPPKDLAPPPNPLAVRSVPLPVPAPPMALADIKLLVHVPDGKVGRNWYCRSPNRKGGWPGIVPMALAAVLCAPPHRDPHPLVPLIVAGRMEEADRQLGRMQAECSTGHSPPQHAGGERHDTAGTPENPGADGARLTHMRALMAAWATDAASHGRTTVKAALDYDSPSSSWMTRLTMQNVPDGQELCRCLLHPDAASFRLQVLAAVFLDMYRTHGPPLCLVHPVLPPPGFDALPG